MENSLNAGATCITVRSPRRRHCASRITGRGIPRRDVPLMAFERHATKQNHKNRTICSPCTRWASAAGAGLHRGGIKLTITTRSIHEETGTRAINEGGRNQEHHGSGQSAGTTIVARELFFNTPVRLKFLKKPATEAAKVAE